MALLNCSRICYIVQEFLYARTPWLNLQYLFPAEQSDTIIFPTSDRIIYTTVTNCKYSSDDPELLQCDAASEMTTKCSDKPIRNEWQKNTLAIARFRYFSTRVNGEGEGRCPTLAIWNEESYSLLKKIAPTIGGAFLS